MTDREALTRVHEIVEMIRTAGPVSERIEHDCVLAYLEELIGVLAPDYTEPDEAANIMELAHCFMVRPAGESNYDAVEARLKAYVNRVDSPVPEAMCCPHGIHRLNACGACIPPRGTQGGKS